ncbi:MAG: MGMT family protein [Phycisphaerae bacterium]
MLHESSQITRCSPQYLAFGKGSPKLYWEVVYRLEAPYRLVSLTLPHTVTAGAIPKPVSSNVALPWLELLKDLLDGYYRPDSQPNRKQIAAWDKLREYVDWSVCSLAQQRVLRGVCAIVVGTTTSYGGLAAMIGSPRAARWVGQALARNPWPLIIPCHRVLGRDGALTGYSGHGGCDQKADFLALERRWSA